MKAITIPAAGMLAGIASMLEELGHETTDKRIAQGMEAPFLCVYEDDCYKAGSALYQPKWVNLYLHPRGFHLVEHRMPSADVPAYLRSSKTTLMRISLSKHGLQPALFTAYTQGRYVFQDILEGGSTEQQTYDLSAAMLRRRLPEEVSLYTLEKIPATPVGVIPLLLESLETIEQYRRDLLQIRECKVTLEELDALDVPRFRALMDDLQPMSLLLGDTCLNEELHLLMHNYQHIFTLNDPPVMRIGDRLPKKTLNSCLTWWREDIIDRLYALGASDEMMGEKVYHER